MLPLSPFAPFLCLFAAHSVTRVDASEVGLGGAKSSCKARTIAHCLKPHAHSLILCYLVFIPCCNSVTCVDVSEVGVGGAKSFFEAKANELQRSKDAEQEIKAEQVLSLKEDSYRREHCVSASCRY